MTTPARSDWMLYGAYGRTGRLILDEDGELEDFSLALACDVGARAAGSGSLRVR
jgi:short subunit dehydrogenase-like uncharacterized protein